MQLATRRWFRRTLGPLWLAVSPHRTEDNRMRPSLPLSLIALITLACSAGATPEIDGSDGLVAEQRRWEAAQLADYRFDFQQQCFCVLEQVQPVTIEVRAGRIARVISRETGEDMTEVEGLRWYTVPDLFRVIADAQQEGITPLSIRYDPELGHPVHIEAGSLAADAGVIYTVANLEPLVG
jgi:hypothetical protein